MCALLMTLSADVVRAQSGFDLEADADAVVTARLRHVESVLSHDERETRRWWRTWICVQSVLLAGNVGWGLIELDDTGARAEHFLNAGGSLLGGLSLIVLRPPALSAESELAELEGNTEAQRAVKLEAAEALLAENADAQAFGTGWAPYAGGFIAGTAIALPLWLKYDRKLGAAASFFGSMAITALQVVTLPTQSLKEREQRPAVKTMAPFAARRSRTPDTEALREEADEAKESSLRRLRHARRARGLTLALSPSAGGLSLAGQW